MSQHKVKTAKKWKVINIGAGVALLVVLSIVSNDVFKDNVWVHYLFLAFTSGVIMYCVLIALGVHK